MNGMKLEKVWIFRCMSEQDKELVLLRIDKKLSFDEIAEYYGITNDACRQRLSRAIRKCRSLLDCEK